MNQRAIEAGARALWRASTYHGYDDVTLEREWDRMKYIWRNQVTAVITAYEAHMKAEGFVVVRAEPTEAMVRLPELPYSPAEMREFWTAMLSAATTGENDASK